MTKAEKEYFRKVAELGCSLCRFLGDAGTPAELHHIRRAGVRAKSPIIPLCTYHHRGDRGVHGMGRKAFEREYKITEEELLEKTQELL